MKNIYLCLLVVVPLTAFPQVDTTDVDDEDWDMYGDFEVADEGPTKLWADAKIVGLSPQRFFSLGWDAHMGYPMMLDRDANGENPLLEPNTQYTGGLRFTSNIPIISRTSFIWQSGINYSDFRYSMSDRPESPDLPEQIRAAQVAKSLDNRGVRVANWVNTFYKPINGGKSFILVQTQVDMAGDFGFNLQSLKYLRYSGAILWGKRPSDYEQWAVGFSRTYRVGAMNYIPVVMYNWTSRSKTWGFEALAPARIHGRYNFSPRSLLLFGYELDGASHRLNTVSEVYGTDPNNSIELRRGEIKFRIDYQFQVTGFFWASIQAGYRVNYSFHIDELAAGEDDFTRAFGLNSAAPDFWMNNAIGNTPYFHFSLNFVSP
ncbi:MAG: hypothetical protein JJU02_11470 [Cryomorphaceae bacterium]|nr:hypothetical protein [Cryomorphaceae bacterium]